MKTTNINIRLNFYMWWSNSFIWASTKL